MFILRIAFLKREVPEIHLQKWWCKLKCELYGTVRVNLGFPDNHICSIQQPEQKMVLISQADLADILIYTRTKQNGDRLTS